MQVRCHLCGVVMQAEDAVRREMRVGRSSGGSSSLGNFGGQFGVLHTDSGQSFYGMVDLCRGCNDIQVAKAKERARREKIKATIGIGFIVCMLVALVIYCFINLLTTGRIY